MFHHHSHQQSSHLLNLTMGSWWALSRLTLITTFLGSYCHLQFAEEEMETQKITFGIRVQIAQKWEERNLNLNLSDMNLVHLISFLYLLLQMMLVLLLDYKLPHGGDFRYFSWNSHSTYHRLKHTAGTQYKHWINRFGTNMNLKQNSAVSITNNPSFSLLHEWSSYIASWSTYLKSFCFVPLRDAL